MLVAPGSTAEVSLTVTPDRTADALGNRGVEVLGTPFLVGLLEQACHAVLAPHLPPGAGTVGTMVEMRHLAPTPVGLTVRARARLLEGDGRRFLFAVEAWDDREQVAEGRHERFVVPDLAKFLARAAAKARA
jgi:predicted thioesterase